MKKLLNTEAKRLVAAIFLCVALVLAALPTYHKTDSVMDGVGKDNAPALLSAIPSAQAQSVIPSGNTQTIYPLTRDTGAVIKFASSGAGVINSSDITGYNIVRVICVMNQSSHSGTPSTTFALQNKDLASGLYYGVATSGAVVNDNAPSYAAFGAVASTGGAQVANLPVAAKWRVQATVGGSTPSVIGTIGCSIQ